MTSLQVILPIPVGINSSGQGATRTPGTYLPTVRVARGGKVYAALRLSPEARQWKADAAMLTRFEAGKAGWQAPTGRLRLAVVRSDGHDLDSGIKLLLDAVALGLGVDDAQFGQVILTRAESCRRDCLLVIVEGMDG
ncbi:MAG: RusA family crossover junction endodeoxyribonuclease [Acidiferrobacterales bacterium]